MSPSPGLPPPPPPDGGFGGAGAGLLRAGSLARRIARLELVPLRIRRRADALEAEGEVVGVRAVAERLVVVDEALLDQEHERLIERLHAVRLVAVRDRVAELLR